MGAYEGLNSLAGIFALRYCPISFFLLEFKQNVMRARG